MRIDCGTCAVRGAACADCVVTFLTIGVREAAAPAARAASSARPPVAAAPPAPSVDLDEAERAAIAVLASSGLVPPLRLTPRLPGSRAG